MIHSFTCKNFYSFGDQTKVSFKVNNNAPKDNKYFTTGSGTRLSKVETVIGPNASGKTHLLKVLPFLKWLITAAYEQRPESLIPVQPFAFGELKDKPIELSVVFEIDSNIYTYSFTITKEKILKEELKLGSFVKEKKSVKVLFSRKWSQKKNSYLFDGKNFELPAKDFKSLLRTNASVVSTAARLNHKTSQVIEKYWGEIETNVIEGGWIEDPWLLKSALRVGETFNFFSENNTFKTEAEKLLRRFDLGLSGFEIKKEKKEGLSFNIRAIHSLNGEEYPLPVKYESSGTKQLFILLKNILVALDKGSIAIIDEIDVNLHPEIIIALYNLFIQPETNPKNAQLIMSTHSHLLLNSLDKYQIILVEKNEKGISESWRLDEMSSVRSDENHYSKYITGAYGSLPNI